jgi:hypothetical protein
MIAGTMACGETLTRRANQRHHAIVAALQDAHGRRSVQGPRVRLPLTPSANIVLIRSSVMMVAACGSAMRAEVQTSDFDSTLPIAV